jgi:glycosyltransferase involved in cell wall biosynthesis
VLRVLLVIHGYPPSYNAGSEVYTQTLARELVNQGHLVAVFSRREDPLRPDFEMIKEVDCVEPRILRYTVNLTNKRELYRRDEVDDLFDKVLNEFKPNIVHVGHLNHLSTSIIKRASNHGIPLVLTLHDFWLMCPRGQFLQTNSGSEQWTLCDGQDDYKCSTHCYSMYPTGLQGTETDNIEYWKEWVHNRMTHINEMIKHIDLFIAPSEYIRRRFIESGFENEKIVYLDYGFDPRRLSGRVRRQESDFVFGYIGTHIVPKGIHLLIEAFGMVRGNSRLRIWGRETPQVTPTLKELGKNLPDNQSDKIEWLGEYRNEDVIQIFNNVDAIVVPSIWVENSPLVIHEAQQARVPVITTDLGGMAEYVENEVNGLLFQSRNIADLTRRMQQFIDDRKFASQLGQRGYIKSSNGDIPTIHDHVNKITELYNAVWNKRGMIS